MNKQRTARIVLNVERAENRTLRKIHKNKFTNKPTPQTTVDYLNKQISFMPEEAKWSISETDSWLRRNNLKYMTQEITGVIPTNKKYKGSGIIPFFELAQDCLINTVGEKIVHDSYKELCMKVR